MTDADEPLRIPYLSDVTEMERTLKQLDQNRTAPEVEEEIIRTVERIQAEASKLVRENRLARGDSALFRPAVKWLQASLVHLFAAGEMLPPGQRVRYLIRLNLVIMAASHIGSFTRLTRTTQAAAAVMAAQRAGKKKLQKVQPRIEQRRAAVWEINLKLPRNLCWKDREAKINAGLAALEINSVDRRTLQRDLKSKPPA